MLPKCKMHSYAKLQLSNCCNEKKKILLGNISWLLVITEMSIDVLIMLEMRCFSLVFYVLLTKHNGYF